MTQTKDLAQQIIGKCFNHDAETIISAMQFALVYVMASAEAQEEGAGNALHTIFARIVNVSMKDEVLNLAASMKAGNPNE